jgi:murein lipoprotein
MMHSFLSKGLMAIALGGSLMAGGCATTGEVQRAQAAADAAGMRADQAFAAAQSAGQRADAANAAAQSAQQAANAAQSSARDAAAAADQAKRESESASERIQTRTRLARGERG